MSEEIGSDGWWTPTKVGVILTAGVLVLSGIMALQVRCVLLPTQVLECRKNYEWFLDSPPNEIGDTLAGFAGTLAFIWIVVTVWLQSAELREQRQVLKAQREEFEEMATAQKAQVKALEAQALIFQDEKAERDEIRAQNLLNELVEYLHVLFIRSFEEEIWKQNGVNHGMKKDTNRVFHNLDASSHRALIASAILSVEGVIERIRLSELVIRDGISQRNLEPLCEIIDTCTSMRAMTKKLSEAQCQKLRNLQIDRLNAVVVSYLDYCYEARNRLAGFENTEGIIRFLNGQSEDFS